MKEGRYTRTTFAQQTNVLQITLSFRHLTDERTLFSWFRVEEKSICKENSQEKVGFVHFLLQSYDKLKFFNVLGCNLYLVGLEVSS